MVNLQTLRHSLAHILAEAVLKLYPKTQLGIGPAIENGFYYDFDLSQTDQTLQPEDLTRIEEEMRKIIKEGRVFTKKIIPKKEAQTLFRHQPYKLELLQELPEEQVTIYQSGEFIDLCQGPHLRSTAQIDPQGFKLEKLAGAYWKGDEKNPMLTRIYGLAFENQKELKNYLSIKEEAEKRDHRLLGQQLKLFLFDQEVGAGLPLWQPKGAILRKLIEDYLYRQLTQRGYQWVVTPHLGNLKLWQTSGHWELYRENIYPPFKIERESYLIKPMNCPFAVKLYQSEPRSYRDLPLKYAEFGTVYRYERSGVLHGLSRVRGFTQDDAHIWCTKEQLAQELKKVLSEGLTLLKNFGFEKFDLYLSTRPAKYAGSKKDWQWAEKVLQSVMKKLKLDFQVDPGGGVFYGPKIDLKLRDSLGRQWQCTTIQIDFNLPERFDLFFFNQKGQKERPVMIHRALLGSLERFIGVLLEHYAGDLPLWLAPTQLILLPLASRHLEYAQQVAKELRKEGFRVELDEENKTLPRKIRDAELQKIPYMLVIGDKEVEEKKVAVRERKKGDLGAMEVAPLIKKLKSELASLAGVG